MLLPLSGRHLPPGYSVYEGGVSSALVSDSSKLLQEKSHAGLNGLVPQISHPIQFHRPGGPPAFSSSDHPLHITSAKPWP